MRSKEKEGQEHEEDKERAKGRGKERGGEGNFHKAEERGRITRGKRQIPIGFDFKSPNVFLCSVATLQTACLFPNA